MTPLEILYSDQLGKKINNDKGRFTLILCFVLPVMIPTLLPNRPHILYRLFNDPDRLCGLVVRVLGYRSGGPGSIPGTTKSSGSGTGSTQPREYN
jgi:hypothetical protein